MKATIQEQELVLELASIDQQLNNLSKRLQQLEAAEEITQKQAALASCNESVAELRLAVEQELAIQKKLESDLALVEKRIDVDNQRVNTATSSKDIDGIQRELASLANRKSALEDEELQSMESAAQLQVELKDLVASQSALNDELARLTAGQKTVHDQLTSEMLKLRLRREKSIALLSEELAQAYERKHQRGVAAGRLDGRDCGACRLALTAAAYDDVIATDAQELAVCPNCQAFLVK